jgi:hypothetical protein
VVNPVEDAVCDLAEEGKSESVDRRSPALDLCAGFGFENTIGATPPQIICNAKRKLFKSRGSVHTARPLSVPGCLVAVITKPTLWQKLERPMSPVSSFSGSASPAMERHGNYHNSVRTDRVQLKYSSESHFCRTMQRKWHRKFDGILRDSKGILNKDSIHIQMAFEPRLIGIPELKGAQKVTPFR